MQITNADASAAILQHVETRSLTQGQWHGRGDDGRHIACLLGSMHPEVGSPSDCNGDLMPLWLAELTPVLFDGLPEDEIYPVAERYGRLIARWHVLTPAAWDGLLTRFLVRVIDDAVEAARPVAEGKPYWPAVEAACKQSQDAIRSGDPSAKADAAAAAYAARARAAAARARAAYAAADAARAAAHAAADAARAAAYAAADAARAAAYLRLFRFLLDEIETEINAAEAA